MSEAELWVRPASGMMTSLGLTAVRTVRLRKCAFLPAPLPLRWQVGSLASVHPTPAIGSESSQAGESREESHL